MPARMNNRLIDSERYDTTFIRQAHRAFYALCTHIDHQLRVVIGTLREEGLLDNTIILFTADHGDMLGDHGLWAKRMFYEGSACVPMIVVGATGNDRVPCRATNDRLVGWQDIMPTLLDLACIPVPDSVDGQSMFNNRPRKMLYGEYGEDAEATRMILDERFKLVYFAYGNRLQLFDMHDDRDECTDLINSVDHANVRTRLTEQLISQMYGSDAKLFRDDELVGLPIDTSPHLPDRTLSLQRGRHWPVPPQS